MDSLFIPGQSGSFPTPLVEFDADTGVMVLTGESHPEDAAAFYAPILQWLDAFLAGARAGALLEVRLTFFSAPTRSQLLEVFARLQARAARGGKVRAIWQVDPSDEDMVETAAELAELAGLEISIVRAEPEIARAG